MRLRPRNLHMGCDTSWRELPFTALSPDEAQWQIAGPS